MPEMLQEINSRGFRGFRRIRDSSCREQGAAGLGAFYVTVGGARPDLAGGWSRVSRDHMTGPGFTPSRGILYSVKITTKPPSYPVSAVTLRGIT
ncbi:hypothetical protein CCACVL1_15047, partial [Corchorus capsularis]